MTEPHLTKGDVLKVIAELTQAVEKQQEAYKKYPSEFKQGKIEAYNFAIGRIKSMARWKGIEV